MAWRLGGRVGGLAFPTARRLLPSVGFGKGRGGAIRSGSLGRAFGCAALVLAALFPRCVRRGSFWRRGGVSLLNYDHSGRHWGSGGWSLGSSPLHWGLWGTLGPAASSGGWRRGGCRGSGLGPAACHAARPRDCQALRVRGSVCGCADCVHPQLDPRAKGSTGALRPGQSCLDLPLLVGRSKIAAKTGRSGCGRRRVGQGGAGHDPDGPGAFMLWASCPPRVAGGLLRSAQGWWLFGCSGPISPISRLRA